MTSSAYPKKRTAAQLAEAGGRTLGCPRQSDALRAECGVAQRPGELAFITPKLPRRVCVCVCVRVCVCLPERFRLWLDGAWVGAPLPAHESPPPAQPGSTSMGAAARTAATVPAPAHRPPPARPRPPARSDRERSVAQSRGWANKPGARPRRVGGSRADRRKPSVAPTHPVVAGRRRSDRTRIEQVAS
jgi:hypothetical protein